jgi:hypothetical protein
VRPTLELLEDGSAVVFGPRSSLGVELLLDSSGVSMGNLEAAMSLDRTRRAWLRATAAHARAAESHEAAAELFGRLHERKLAARESELAAAEQRMYVRALARHPEWAGDVEELLVSWGVSAAARELAAEAASSR